MWLSPSNVWSNGLIMHLIVDMMFWISFLSFQDLSSSLFWSDAVHLCTASLLRENPLSPSLVLESLFALWLDRQCLQNHTPVVSEQQNPLIVPVVGICKMCVLDCSSPVSKKKGILNSLPYRMKKITCEQTLGRLEGHGIPHQIIGLLCPARPLLCPSCLCFE